MKASQRSLRLRLDRLLSKNLFLQLGFLAIVLIAVLSLSYLFLALSGSEWKAFCEEKDLSRWLLPLYLLIDSNALNNLYLDGHVHGWMLFASSITFLCGAFVFNGVLIGIITNSLEQRIQKHKSGHIHYLKSGHYIIMGYDDMVPSIITHIFEKDAKAFVLLLSAAETPYIREKLKRFFSEQQLKQIIINYGHRMSKDYYSDIHLEFSVQVYIVGLRSLPAHDAINVECVDSICRYLKQPEVEGRPKRIICVFEDLDTYAAFKTSMIFREVQDLGIEFVPYNFYMGWAKQVFVKRFHKDMDKPNERIPYPAVFGNGIKPDDPKNVHLVFIGTTYFAVAFAMEAANMLHFPNFHKMGKRTRITFIDINADTEKSVFITRNRHLFEIQPYEYYDYSDKKEKEPQGKRDEYVCFSGKDKEFLDVEFEFIKGDIFSKDVQDVIRKWAKDKQQYLSIFIALNNQRSNFAFGMNMPDEVYDNEIPVFIRQDRSDKFVSDLRATDSAIKKDEKKNEYVKIENDKAVPKTLGGRYANIYPFGMNETAYSADEKSLERAKLINYLYCTANYNDNRFKGILVLDAIPKEQLWNEANEHWRQLTVALKWSNLYNAYTLRTKVATLRVMRGLQPDDNSRDYWPLSEDEVEEMARVEHNRWNVEKLLMGYRKPRQDEDKYAYPEHAGDLKKNKNHFIHNDIRPFDQLDSIRELDYEFSRYIPWIMRITEYK